MKDLRAIAEQEIVDAEERKAIDFIKRQMGKIHSYQKQIEELERKIDVRSAEIDRVASGDFSVIEEPSLTVARVSENTFSVAL